MLAANRKTDALFEEKILQLDADKKVCLPTHYCLYLHSSRTNCLLTHTRIVYSVELMAFASSLHHQIAKSKAVADSRKKKGEMANDLVAEIHSYTLKTLAQNVKSNQEGYKKLLVKLMSEGLVQVDEQTVQVECLASDADLVAGLCEEALNVYKQAVDAMYKEDPVKFESQYQTSLSCNISVSQRGSLPEVYVGGVKLVGDNGRIICDNTLKTRLNICVEEQLPAVRATLFPSMKTEIRDFSADEMKSSH